jgi:hypothetical protein
VRRPSKKNSKHSEIDGLDRSVSFSLNLVRHDSMRQLILTQLTHLFGGATLPETGAKQAIGDLTASDFYFMNHCVNLSDAA